MTRLIIFENIKFCIHIKYSLYSKNKIAQTRSFILPTFIFDYYEEHNATIKKTYFREEDN